jgi:hypothetical protein
VAFQDLAHFFVILAVVFLVYAALGHITLGGQLRVFASMESTCQNLFNFMALGRSFTLSVFTTLLDRMCLLNWSGLHNSFLSEVAL